MSKITTKELNTPFYISMPFSKKDTHDEGDEPSDVITVQGYASTDDEDRMGDVVPASVWSNEETLRQFKENPIVLAFHDHRQPIGKVTEITPDSKGLWVKAEVHRSADERVFRQIESGVLKTFSIGFLIKDAEYRSDIDKFFITQLDLLEISVVSVPANGSALFDVEKDVGHDIYEKFKQYYTDKSVREENERMAKENEPTNDNGNTPSTGSDQGNKVDVESIIKQMEERQAAREEEKRREEEAKKAQDEKVAELASEAAKSQVEKLSEQFKKDLEDQSKSFQEVLEKFAPHIKENQEEIQRQAAGGNEDLFTGNSSGDRKTVEKSERMAAVIVSKALNRPIKETKYFHGLVAKAGDHLVDMTEDWEQEFNTTIQEEMRDELIIAPRFTTIQMNARTMNLPIDPEADYGEWIDSADFKSSASTGTAGTHTLKDIALTAYKLAAKERIGYEEEEDTILAMMPVIQRAVARRIAKSTDRALLRGQGAAGDPISGFTKLAQDAGKVHTTADDSADKTVTVMDLQKTRRQLGRYAIEPSNVVYIVSRKAYFDLLEDPDFRTVDMVGNSNATILTGQIGFANGSPVLVSNEFDNAALDSGTAGTVAAAALRADNFLLGNLRGVMTESDRDVENQTNLIVTTRRMAFSPIIADEGAAVAELPTTAA